LRNMIWLHNNNWLQSKYYVEPEYSSTLNTVEVSTLNTVEIWQRCNAAAFYSTLSPQAASICKT